VPDIRPLPEILISQIALLGDAGKLLALYALLLTAGLVLNCGQ
jgi:hypothetical protein